jgi:hypothetical protein
MAGPATDPAAAGFARRAARTCLGLLLLSTSPSWAQYEFGECERDEVWQATVKEWRSNGFRISLDGAAAGLGFAVGWDEGRLWIATPAHVAYGKDLFGPNSWPGPEVVRDRLAIRPLLDDQELALCDDPDNPRGFTHPRDLTFVCVRRPPAHFLQRELTAEIVSAGDQYRLIGALGQPRPEELGGRLALAVDADETGFGLELRSETARAPMSGLSGAMVVTPAGLAGLYVGAADHGRAIDIPTLREEADDAEVPWSLTSREFFDCTSEREVCLTVDDPPRPDELIVEARDRRVPVRLRDGRACVSLPEGKYTVRPVGTRLRCEPLGFRVFNSSTPLTAHLTCRPEFVGGWSAGPLGDLLCTQGASGAGSCTGLLGVGRGLFSGALSLRDGEVVLSGRFLGASAVGVSGNLTWMDGRLEGEIRLAEPDANAIPLVLKEIE